MLCLFSIQQELLHVVQLPLRSMIIDLQIIGLDIQDQDQLLSVIVKSDDFVEQHQVHILEAFLVLRIQPQGRFAVFDIVIGKISYQTSGKGRQSRSLGLLFSSMTLRMIPLTSPESVRLVSSDFIVVIPL